MADYNAIQPYIITSIQFYCFGCIILHFDGTEGVGAKDEVGKDNAGGHIPQPLAYAVQHAVDLKHRETHHSQIRGTHRTTFERNTALMTGRRLFWLGA